MNTTRSIFFHINLALVLLLLTGCAAGQGLPGLLILSCLLLFFTQCSGLLLKEDTFEDFFLRRFLIEVKENSSSSSSSSGAACSNTLDYTQTFDLASLDPATAGIGFTISGENSNDKFGYNIGTTTGDFNGDGINDILIASPSYSGTNGKAYLVFGQSGTTRGDLSVSGMAASDGITIGGAANFYLGNYLGSIDFAGDVNGDGFDDLILGGPIYAANGGAALIFGSASPANTSLPPASSSVGVLYQSEGSNDYLGRSVSAAGDVNGDGIDDFVIAAPYNSRNTAYIVFGQTSGFTTPLSASTIGGATGFTVSGATRVGNNVKAAGDLNADGIDDLVIGSDTTVKSYVIYGVTGTRSNIDVTSLGSDGFEITGTSGQWGKSQAGGGDFNGDGTPDFAAGNLGYSSSTGQAALFFGDVGAVTVSSLTSSEGFRLSGSATNESAGASMALGGDVNGDGFDDFFIGGTGADHNSRSNSGSASLVFGRSDVPTGTDLSTYTDGTTGIRIDGAAASDNLGSAVSLSDVNGDGCADMIVGAEGADKTYVIFGGLAQ